MTDHQDYTDNRTIKQSREGDYLLIDLVRQNPHLYNKELKDFKDIDRREETWREISSIVNLNVNDCQQRWVRLREKFSKERRIQEDLERNGNKEFKQSSWPFYEDLRFLEPYIKRRKVYQKPRYLDLKVNNTTISPKVHAVFNAQPFTQLKTIQTANVAQHVGFKQGNLSLLQVPKTVMVQLVGNQKHISSPKKTVAPNLSGGESSLPSNVEVVYEKEEISSESSSSSPENNESSPKKKKRGKRKCDDSAEKAISNLSSVIEKCLETYKKEDDSDEIFGKLIGRELANKPEPQKAKLKRKIMRIIWDDSEES